MKRPGRHSGTRENIERPVEEPVVGIARALAPGAECRAIVGLITPNQRFTPAEAHKLLTEQPGALYLTERGRRINLVPAQRGHVLYVRTLPEDSPTDPLLALPVEYEA